MTYRIVIQTAAHEDIARNVEWWSVNRDSKDAIEWKNAAYGAIRSLADDPTRHALAPEDDHFDITVRQILFGRGRRPSYRIVYAVREAAVHVFAIRRFAQDAISSTDIDPTV